MNKNLLLFGASLSVAMGSALLILTLAFTLVMASVENSAAVDSCEEKRSNGDCGAGCPADQPNCNITKVNTCACVK